MNSMFRFIISVIALVATTFSVSAQTSTTPVAAPNLLMTLVSAPTITATNISSGGNTNVITKIEATYIASLQAVGADITIGLPGSSYPLITWTDSGSVTILRNGTPDLNKNYTTTVSYTQPSSGVTSGSGSTFILKKDNAIRVPIVVSFVVTNGGANTYAVRLQLAYWTYSAGGSATTLSESGWTTTQIAAVGGGSTPITPTTPVPDYIQALRSTADLGAYLAVKARVTDIYVSGTSQVGNTVTKRIEHKGPVTTRIIQEAVKNAALEIKVTNINQEIYYQIDVHSADYRIALSDFQSQKPSTVKGGYAADFKMKLSFQGDVLMLVPNIASALLKNVDATGRITDTISLNITQQGFYISPKAVASGILEITVNDGSPNGSLKSYDLRTATETTATSVAVTSSVTKADTEYVLDKGVGELELNLIPSIGGHNVLGEVEIVRNVADVYVGAMTMEGRPAVSIDYRQITAVVIPGQAPVPVADNNLTRLSAKMTNGVVGLRLAKGDWQIIPRWNPKDFSEPPYTPPTDGKGSVQSQLNN